ncbi:lipopolysaccharide transport system ATP-binding protein [Aurantimicrobium minutum]|uniref:ABC transporter ATP-binding protein n=1 Tax=Aurantimicrobium minutum TaxID=708131 RepID=UPI0024764407|nr:ABC transporter ATP-binding protein [Aurantimicrobium minutum]MDH6533355.1 lipopolysaccharide transport system ATP-binding protein [Aurantimicrobium minutum]
MSKINLFNVNVEFPIFNASSRRLANQLIRAATGGQVGRSEGGKVTVRALNDINLQLKSGDRLGIVGHNGAGKSTLLRLLAGIYEPSSGKIERGGIISSLTDIALGISPELTGRDNIITRGVLMGMTRSQIQAQMNEIIEFSELGEFIDLPVRTYSTGMGMRLAFSVSTIMQPEILIMDEWLSVGDEDFVHKAENRIRAVVDNSDILIIASHSRGLLERNCNRAIWLEHGEIKLSGNIDEILDAYFGKSNSPA